MESAILEALAPFRTSLQADGADLQVVQVNDQQLEMELVVSDKTCLDCVVPKAVMENIIVTQLGKVGLQFLQFQLNYPQL